MMAYIPKEGTVWSPFSEYPRNAECFCGSEVKFKKCCINKISPTMTLENFEKVRPYIAAIRAGKFRLMKKEEKNESVTSIDSSGPTPTDRVTSESEQTSSPGADASSKHIPASIKSDASDTNS